MNWAIVLGALVALFGASIVLNAIFHLQIPLVRSALALLLVALGVRIAVRAWAPARGDGAAIAPLAEERVEPRRLENGDLQYDVVFERGVVDLTRLPRPDRELTVTVNAILGTATVIVDPTLPYDIQGTAAGVRARPPAGAPPRLHLKLNAVFGGCYVVERPGPPRLSPGEEPLPMGTPLF